MQSQEKSYIIRHGSDNMQKYKVNSIVKATVTGIESYGAFVTLDEYYSGLIHISEISHNFVKDINDYVKVGETIKAKVIDVEDDFCHLKLSIKNINYKINPRKKEKIKEVGTGFGILENNLDNWIKCKIEKINKKN